MTWPSLPPELVDPIFVLRKEYLNDPAREKMDLGMGVFQNEHGFVYSFPTIKKAQDALSDRTLEYGAIEGSEAFAQAIVRWCGVPEPNVVLQTLGGCGALHLFARYASSIGYQIALPQPTWSNHHTIFAHAITYPYYSDALLGPDAIEMKSGQTIYLHHTVCHNPTGFDWDRAMWDAWLDRVAQKNAMLLFDTAYHGFGDTLESDISPVVRAIERGIPVAMAYSCSKNFGVYGERVGALMLWNGPQALLGYFQKLVRASYSNPPRYGAALVTHTLQNSHAEHLSVLAQLRVLLQQKRNAFCTLLQKHIPRCLPKNATQAKGLFLTLKLTAHEMESLRQHHIYLPRSGRVNISGIHSFSYLEEVLQTI